MKFRYVLPVLSAIGFSFASYTVVSSNQPMPIAPAVVEPSASPYKTFIAGAGLVEAKNKNIAIGTPLSGIVTKLPVKVGDKVKAGALLFALDERDSRAELAIRRADVLKAQADVSVARATLQDSQSLYDLARAVSDKRAISSEDVLKRRNAVLIAQAKLDSALAFVQQALANLASSQTTLERLSVRAPIDGEVLQVNLRVGEFASAGVTATPLLLLGNLEQFHVRVDIDENDAWRFKENGNAIAYLRGNRQFKVDLKLAYIEPFVIPKKSLTGESTERVDTRVLQALYSFEHDKLPVYVGQQMDVFIETPETNGAAPL